MAASSTDGCENVTFLTPFPFERNFSEFNWPSESDTVCASSESADGPTFPPNFLEGLYYMRSRGGCNLEFQVLALQASLCCVRSRGGVMERAEYL
jgi:hypothetical protein